MKKILTLLSYMVILSLSLSASSRSNVQILEATEEIRYLGQKISKDYLLFYNNSKNIKLKSTILKDIESINQSIKNISMSTTSVDSQNILDFLIYNEDEIKELLKEKVTEENSILMLDYSESFLEGANSIADEHKYEFSNEEKMLMLMKEFDYLMERTLKYYLASNLKLNKLNNYEHMKNAISKVDKIIEKIDSYTYPDELKREIVEMKKIWKRDKEFFFKATTLFTPKLLTSVSENIKNTIDKLALYHKKNQ